MKKLLFVFLSTMFLFGCSSEETTKQKKEEPTQEDSKNEETNKVEATQEELNEKLKSEAVQANFVELNDPAAEENKKVFAEGEVSVISETGPFKTFNLTTNQGDGFGIYSIVDILEDEEYQEGDIVKIYGTFKGKNNLGMPEITSTVIEKQ
ncbi:hypothetical protein KDN24_22900 [Bacillus sp. Bva_UNVM-123]|uniref:hypothetical protein n=1 Tax=Bacillus sp. Bva_UNVM-123 TaxID=2829798 RepID=UPI00391F8B31